MIEGSLSRRYAKALFQLALQGQKEDEVGEELERFGAAYAGSPLASVLNNPAFSLESRMNVVANVSKSLQLSPVVIHFLSLLLERHRLAFFPWIASRYRRLLDEAKGRVEARVVSASPLGAEIMEKLRETLRAVSGKQVLLRDETDPSLMGGLVVHLEGKVYDGSVRTQLERMKERIERGY